MPITADELMTEAIMGLEEQLECSFTRLEEETLRRMFSAVILREEKADA